VLERQTGGSLSTTRDHEGGDLDHLALTPRRGCGLLLRRGDVVAGGKGVAAAGRHHGHQGLLDPAHRGWMLMFARWRSMGHVGSVRRAADAALT
jgi:hypothetical protein